MKGITRWIIMWFIGGHKCVDVGLMYVMCIACVLLKGYGLAERSSLDGIMYPFCCGL